MTTQISIFNHLNTKIRLLKIIKNMPSSSPRICTGKIKYFVRMQI